MYRFSLCLHSGPARWALFQDARSGVLGPGAAVSLSIGLQHVACSLRLLQMAKVMAVNSIGVLSIIGKGQRTSGKACTTAFSRACSMMGCSNTCRRH